MLGDWQSYNPIYGTTNNPWDLTRTPGGSTGGGAAEIAAGLSALTMGSDLNGSIRIPAHFCGVYGHKPSLNLVSTEGFQPGPWDGGPGYPMDISVVGPMARDARDLALAMQVLSGPNGDETAAWTWRMPSSRHKRIEDFRIGYVGDDAGARLAPDVARAYDDALSALGRTGAKMDRGWPAGFDISGQMQTFGYLLSSLVNADVSPDQRQRFREQLQRDPQDVFAAGAVEPHARWLHETQRRLAVRVLWQKYFETHDVLLMPVSIAAAFPHDHTEPITNRVVETQAGKRAYVRDVAFWIMFASLAGLPATVAPIGVTTEGLPVGIQIVAPMWEDGTSIEFAALLSAVVGGFSAPPAFRE